MKNLILIALALCYAIPVLADQVVEKVDTDEVAAVEASKVEVSELEAGSDKTEIEGEDGD